MKKFINYWVNFLPHPKRNFYFSVCLKTFYFHLQLALFLTSYPKTQIRSLTIQSFQLQSNLSNTEISPLILLYGLNHIFFLSRTKHSKAFTNLLSPLSFLFLASRTHKTKARYLDDLQGDELKFTPIFTTLFLLF